MNQRLKRPTRSRLGSTIVLALGFGIILLIVVGGLRNFSSYRIQSSIREWNNLKASSQAEAGLAMVMAELSQHFSFETHAVGKDLKWGAAKNMQQVDFNGNGGVQLTGGENFSGQIPGVDGSFEVRCGVIPYEDDPSTNNIDEEKAYILVESIGNFKNTFRKITAVLNRRFPGKECLMYDGDVLSIVYGDASTPGKSNTFSKGDLYGHFGVEISQILRTNFSGGTTGTKQKFVDVPRIMSGKGGIFFLSSVSLNGLNISPSSNWDNKDFSGLDYEGGPSKNHCGQYPKQFMEAAPTIPVEAAQYLRDKNNPVVMTPAFLPTEYYKKLAGGTTTSPTESHPTYTGGTSDMVCLDFGDAIRAPKAGLPSGEIIYSDNDIVIRGNPDRNVTIVSKKNIYVDGDFNQGSNRSGDMGNDTTGAEKYCFPQNYSGNPLDYEAVDYAIPTDKYKIARVIAGERLIFDYRNIKKVFGNEVFPFMKYKIAERIMDDETKAFDSFLKVDGNEKIEKTGTASYTYIQTTVSTNTTTILSQETDPSNPDSLKPDAIEKAKIALLGMVGTYTKTDLGLDTEWAGIETDLKTKIPDPTNWSESSEMMPGYPQTDSDGNKVEKKKFTMTAEVKFLVDCCRTDDVMKALIKDKYWEKLADAGARKLFDDLASKVSGNNVSGDYLFYPELTTVGMFNSFAKRSADETFYPGADFSKHYDEAGQTVPALSFIHRLYGTQANFRTTEVSGQGGTYNPPIRKKIYDTNIVKQWDANNILDVPTYGLMTWKESAAAGFTF